MADPTPIRGQIPWGTVDLRLRAGRSIWLATVRPDGRPMVVPVWYCWDGSSDPPRLYFITARTTQKARNLVNNDWVEAHLGDGDEVQIVRGHAARVEDRAESDAVDAAYRERYVDPHTGTRASIYDNPADDLYRLDAQVVIAWSYGTVGTWTEWRFGP
jgi:nitroimidazol reductase NimA-like FMN-containing flavoprotein (pyridoxamine 5'-phosphate oxidase superfamily)